MATRFTFCARWPRPSRSPRAPTHRTRRRCRLPTCGPPRARRPPGPRAAWRRAQHRDFVDATGDSRTAPDLGAIAVDVREDCGVDLQLRGATLAPGQSLTDRDRHGRRRKHRPPRPGRRRSHPLRPRRPGDARHRRSGHAAGSPPTPPAPVVRTGATTAVDTRVDALGLLPGRAARLTFSSAGTEMDADFAPEASAPASICSSTSATSRARPMRSPRHGCALKGRAKVGRTLTCVAPAE